MTPIKYVKFENVVNVDFSEAETSDFVYKFGVNELKNKNVELGIRLSIGELK